MKIAIATPAYGAQLEAAYCQGLLMAQAQGLVSNWMVINNESLVPRARNRIASQFLAMDDDVLLFIDADIGFTPEDIQRVVSHDKLVVGGCYRKKVIGGGFVFNGGTDEEGDLLKVTETGTGFLAIKKQVLETLKPIAQEIVTDEGVVYWDFFPTGVMDESKRYLSEDWGFCHLCHKAGIDIWVDRGVRLSHTGRYIYK